MASRMRRNILQAVLLVLLHCRQLTLAQDWCVPSCYCMEEDLGARIADCSHKNWLNIDSEMLGTELRVQGLDLSHNSIAELPAYFPDNMKGRWRLLALTVSNNRISIVSPDALRGLTSLNSLDLSDNRIATLPQGFLLAAPSLRALSLDGNNRVLPSRENGGPLLESPNLTRLSLQRCKLGYISPTALSRLPSLETLDLSGNELTEIPAQLPPLLHRLEIFDNPLHCSDPEVRARLLKLEQVHTDCVLTDPQDPNLPKRSEAMINAHDVGIPAVFAGLMCETIFTPSSEDEDYGVESMTAYPCEATPRKPKWLYLWGMPAFWAASAGFLVGIMMSAWTIWCCQQMDECFNCWCSCCCRRRRGRTLSRHAQSDATLLLGDSTPSLLVEDVNRPPGTPPPPYGRNSNAVNYEDFASWAPHA